MGDHGYDYYDVGRNLTTHAEAARARKLGQPDDPISYARASWLGFVLFLGVAVLAAALAFFSFEAGRKAERENIKAAAKGYLP